MKTRARRRRLYKQCLTCNRICDGPYAGKNPGKQVTTYHGVQITHGYCDEHDPDMSRDEPPGSSAARIAEARRRLGKPEHVSETPWH